MSNDNQSTFDVLIRTTADPTGSKETEADLDRLKQKAASTSDGTGIGLDGQARATNAAEIAELEKSQQATLTQILSTDTAISETEAARTAAAARTQSIIAQRQIIVDAELEATQALAAGDTERAAALTADIELRTQALRLQTSAQLSEEESFAIVRARIAAEADITLQKQLQAAAANEGNAANILSGASLSRARNEATTLARELSTGASTSRTFGALIGSLGPAIGIAGLAAFLLYENFDKVEKVLQSISDTIYQIDSVGVAKQITAAHDLAAEVTRAEHESYDQLNTDIESLTRKLEQLNDKRREAITAGDDKSVGKLNEQIRQQELLLATKKEELGLALIDKTNEEAKTAELQRQVDTRKKDIELQSDATKAADDFRKAQEAALGDGEKLDLWKEKITEVRAEIERFGISATTPAKAFDQLIGTSDELRAQVIPLVTEWAKLGTEIKKTSDSENEAAQKEAEHHREQIAAINSEVAALQQKRTELTKELAVTTDPTKHAALQKEIDDLNLQLLVKQKIKDATDAAAAAGKKWTDAESKALETEIAGPLGQKLKLLQQAAALFDPASADAKNLQKQVNDLVNMKPPSQDDMPTYLQKIIDDATQSTIAVDAAKRALAGYLVEASQQIKVPTQPGAPTAGAPPSASTQQAAAEAKAATETAAADAKTAIETISTSTKQGLDQITIAVTNVSTSIPPLYTPVAEAISSQLTQVISDGNKLILTAITNVKTAIDRELADQQSQIDSLWQQT
jgi:hypothetical protein